MERQMLDENFHRYPEVLDEIRAGAAGFRPALAPVLEAASRVLQFDQELTIEVLFYVGMLEPNAFAAVVNGRYLVHLPLESQLHQRPFIVAHELTHLLHAKLCHDRGGWLRSIAMTMMQEGLAIWTSRAVFPDFPEYQYAAWQKPGWLEQCREGERGILAGIRPHLAESSNEALMKFLFGPGPTGLDREAYYAGYRVVGGLLEKGYSLAQLARMTEPEFTPVIDRMIAELLSWRMREGVPDRDSLALLIQKGSGFSPCSRSSREICPIW